jgi:hypothetical protein
LAGTSIEPENQCRKLHECAADLSDHPAKEKNAQFPFDKGPTRWQLGLSDKTLCAAFLRFCDTKSFS